MFPERLKEVRKAKKLSQRDLAQALSVSQQTIGSWEVGRSEPNTELLQRIANYFNVTVDYLLENEKEKSATHPKHIDVEDIVDQQAMLTSRNHALSDEDRNAIRALLTTYLNSSEGQDRLRKFGGYDEEGNKKDEK
ncbi:helix-turn-helix transcriptional regulator [Lactobacillus acetotolerans]|uniref:helix-turn-helix transcriptional regulator n=1 Tax=Lactobacillus acetotolerans TaxID=1600 RepID=UPI002FDA569A